MNKLNQLNGKAYTIKKMESCKVDKEYKPKKKIPEKERYNSLSKKQKDSEDGTMKYIGKHLARSPSYAKKQFGIKEGAHTKIATVKKKKK